MMGKKVYSINDNSPAAMAESEDRIKKGDVKGKRADDIFEAGNKPVQVLRMQEKTISKKSIP